MVAKVKGSFLKKNFQLFCYRHILSNNSKNTTTSTSPSSSVNATSSSESSSTSFSNSNSAPGSPKINSKQRHEKLKTHSTSSPNLNGKSEGNNDALKKDNELKTLTKSGVKSTQNHTDPKENYYSSNRKHLSKIIQSKKSSASSKSPNQIPNSNSAHTLPIPNSDLQLLADLNQNLDLLKRHQKRSKSSINFSTALTTDSNYKNDNTSTSNNVKANSSNNNNNNVNFSNPNIEIDFINFNKKSSALVLNEKGDIGNRFKQSEEILTENNITSNIKNKRGNEMSINLDKIDSLVNSTSQIISSPPQKTSSSGSNGVNGGNSLYKNNQSIANLKLAKRMQLMQKFNNENNSVNLTKQMYLNGDNFSRNGMEHAFASKYDYINSSNTMSRTKFKSSILNTDLAANRRSFSASKKVVRFADALGLELESIITLNQMEETNRRLRLKNDHLKSSTAPKTHQQAQHSNHSSNNNNYANIAYETKTSYGEFARELYQKDNKVNANVTTSNFEKIPVNQYQNDFKHQQAYLNEIMSQMSLGNTGMNGVSIGGDTKVGSTTDVLTLNNTNIPVIKRNKTNENNFNFMSKQNLNLNKRLSEDLNNVNSSLKYNLAPQNNLSSNGNSDRDETSSNSSDQLNQEKNFNNQVYLNEKLYQYQTQHQQPINYQSYNSHRVSNRNAATLPVYQLKLMKGQISNVNNSKAHVNISNNQEGNNNIKITTRINNGKLESEV